MAKAGLFIISLIIFSILIAGLFAPLMSDLNDKYQISGYNQTSIDAYNKMSELQENIEATKVKSTELQSKSGVIDVLGGFFQSAYDGLKVAVGSFGIFSSLADESFNNLPIANSEVFKSGLILIVIVVIFLGILIAAAIKKEMI